MLALPCLLSTRHSSSGSPASSRDAAPTSTECAISSSARRRRSCDTGHLLPRRSSSFDIEAQVPSPACSCHGLPNGYRITDTVDRLPVREHRNAALIAHAVWSPPGEPLPHPKHSSLQPRRVGRLRRTRSQPLRWTSCRGRDYALRVRDEITSRRTQSRSRSIEHRRHSRARS